MTKLTYRKAIPADVTLLYDWVNDPIVRKSSFQQSLVHFEEHVKWFNKKLSSLHCYIYIFLDANNNQPVGQVRIDKDDNEVIIGVSVSQNFRGLSLSSTMLNMACDAYFKENERETIVAYIKEENVPSYKSFIKAGFNNVSKVLYHNETSFRLTKKA